MSKFKKEHDFLKNWSKGNNVSTEDRAINIDKLRNIKICIVSLADHKKYFNFEDSDELIDNFHLNAGSKFVPSPEVSIRCDFSLENIQPTPLKTGVSIGNLRYWSTEVYAMKYFNNYLLFSLKKDTKKTILANDQSSNSWRFHRFIYLHLKIYTDRSKLL